MSDCLTCKNQKVLYYYGEVCICADCSDDVRLSDYIKQLQEENKLLRECVEFYAAEDNWEKYHDKAYSDCCIVNKDWSDNYSGNNGLKDIFAPKGGKLARKTLAKIKGE